jgi:phage recombination protein Bet
MGKQLAKSSSEIQYSQEQVELIKSQIAPKASDNELKLFLYQAQRTGLDALSRQIYCIHRNQWNAETRQSEPKMTIQTSIDGFRVVAERSGNYGGQSKPIFQERDGRLLSCEISVFRFHGTERYEASVGLAFWDEYVPVGKDGQPTGMWKKMPHTMLSKVAEALALRKAFPQDLSGLYTTEEMSQADFVATETVAKSEPASQEQPSATVIEEKVDTGLETWRLALDAIQDKKGLVAFYTSNATAVTSNEEIQKLFKARQSELEPK